MTESLKENLVDLLAGTPPKNSIPSGEDTSGENLKCKLNRGDSADYCVVHKRVQFALDQREDNVSDLVDDEDINGSNTNSNAVNSHKRDESAGSFVSNNSPRFTNRGGPHLSEYSVTESSSNSSRFTPLRVPQPCELFSMTLQKNITTGTGHTSILLNFSHQKMCVWWIK
jgi:hypothetical protein